MKVTVIGTGSAFSPENTNTSFVVETKKGQTVLVDCGYNVFGTLKKDYPELLAKIDHVLITHLHDDHIGSLGTLVFYKYFVEGRRDFFIISTDAIIEDVRIQKIAKGKLLKGSVLEDAAFAYLNSISGERGRSLDVRGINTNHMVEHSVGFVFLDERNFIFISGDTKAHAGIELELNKIALNRNGIIFHDYSGWDCPSRNVHACANDMEAEYSKEFNDAVQKVHNDDPLLVGKTFDPAYASISVYQSSEHYHG